MESLFNFFFFSENYCYIVFFLAFCVQLFYYLFIFTRIWLHQPSDTSKTLAEIPVSVILCARNEAKNLSQFLPFFLEQDYTKYEVIVVNDNSTDNTSEVLKGFQKKYPHLNVLETKQSENKKGNKKKALTLGIGAAKYEHVLLSDADCKPATNQWIKKMSVHLSDNKIVLGFGDYKYQKGWLNKLIRFETIYTALQYFSFALAKIPYMGVGRNLAYPTAMFFKNKGFESHKNIASGDDDLFINEVANHQNTAVCIDKEAHTISVAHQSFSAWISQKRRHITTGTSYSLKHKFLLGLLSFSQLLFISLFFILIFSKSSVSVFLLFAIRSVLQHFVFYKTTKKLNSKDLLMQLVLLDIFFTFYYPILFIIHIFSPLKKWK